MERVRARTLVHVHQKYEGKPLAELLLDFDEATARHRQQVEEKRIIRTEKLPDPNGYPEPKFSVGGYFRSRTLFFKSLWTSLFNREEKQYQVSQMLGSLIDDKIRSAGGDLTELQSSIDYHNFVRELDGSLLQLRSALKAAIFSANVNSYTPGGNSAKMALAAHVTSAFSQADNISKQVSAIIEHNPEFKEKLSSLDVRGVGIFSAIAAPVMSSQRESIDQAKVVVECVDEFRSEQNNWDVMEAYENIWKRRSELCSHLGLTSEAEAASKVAHEFDRTRFESVDNAWKQA